MTHSDRHFTENLRYRSDDEALGRARDAFPNWKILVVFGGYAAVRADAELIQAPTVDAVVNRIRNIEAGQEGPS